MVVASGCSDETVPAVIEVGGGDPRLQLYVELERSGKAAALNFALERISLSRAVLISGDVLPAPGSIPRLLEAVSRPGVGVAGGRPVPLNREDSFVGHTVHLLWRLHHRLALKVPKVGEMVAFRLEAVRSVPPTSVDEASMQAAAEARGWSSVYVPEAVVWNRGPERVVDFLRQRRRINCGHLWLERRYGYTVPSLRLPLLLREFASEVVSRRPWGARKLLWAAGAACLEALARFLARMDFLRGREAYVWEVVESAKWRRDRGESPSAG